MSDGADSGSHRHGAHGLRVLGRGCLATLVSLGGDDAPHLILAGNEYMGKLEEGFDGVWLRGWRVWHQCTPAMVNMSDY